MAFRMVVCQHMADVTGAPDTSTTARCLRVCDLGSQLCLISNVQGTIYVLYVRRLLLRDPSTYQPAVMLLARDGICLTEARLRDGSLPCACALLESLSSVLSLALPRLQRQYLLVPRSLTVSSTTARTDWRKSSVLRCLHGTRLLQSAPSHPPPSIGNHHLPQHHPPARPRLSQPAHIPSHQQHQKQYHNIVITLLQTVLSAGQHRLSNTES